MAEFRLNFYLLSCVVYSSARLNFGCPYVVYSSVWTFYSLWWFFKGVAGPSTKYVVYLFLGAGTTGGLYLLLTYAETVVFSTLFEEEVTSAQFGKNSRPVAANSNRFFISASADSKAPANFLLKLPSVRFIIMALTIFVILPGPLCDCAQASEAIKASSLGLKVASFLRRTGWPDEAIVFLIAMLPVLELRGAIPVGYWMHMDPVKLSLLSVLGNMVPVPFIVLYMEKLAKFLSNKSSIAKKMMDALFESTREKAAPIQEFEWLGLMLFVAVPFPGTGAWTGAMAASVLGMPFWEAMSANFFGVVMAGLLVNLLVNLGLKYATMVGIALFLISTFMWSFLRAIGKSKH